MSYRVRIVTACFVIGCVVAGRQAHAQEPVTAPPAAAPSEADATEQASAEDSLVEDLYALAFEALARGQRDRAVIMLREIRDQHSEHHFAPHAVDLLAVLEQPQLAVATPERFAAGSKPKTTSAARAELIFFQTVNGLALGVETCAVLECDDARAWAASIMGGAGLGLGVSVYASRDGVTPGLARALTAGVEWGAWNALTLGFATDYFESSDDEQRIPGGLMIGQLAGLGAGAALSHFLTPTAGQVSLTSSGGIWTTVGGALTVLIADVQDDDNALVWTAWGASTAGLIGGGFLAKHAPMTTSRVLLIDAGGLIGVLGGGGFGLLVQGEDATGQFVGTTALLGLGSGLALAAYLTSDADPEERADATSFDIGVVPVQGGAQALARGTF